MIPLVIVWQFVLSILLMRARSQNEADESQAHRNLTERIAAEPIVHFIVDILNQRPHRRRRDRGSDLDRQHENEVRAELAELMDSWLAAGCDLEQWRLRKRFERDLNKRKLRLTADPVSGIVRHGLMDPVRRRVDLEVGSRYKVYDTHGRFGAIELFFEFIIGPLQRTVGRCKRCQKYYWNRWGHSNKQYCTARCARAESATQLTFERRRREHEESLGNIRAAIGSFERLSPARSARIRNWKKWVNQETGISLNFITRAINRGEIAPPKGAK
jgi:hypothetical protein